MPNRPLLLVTAVVATLLGPAACGTSRDTADPVTPTATAIATAPASGTPGPAGGLGTGPTTAAPAGGGAPAKPTSGTTDPLLSPKGLDPWLVGVSVAQLRSLGLVDTLNTIPSCPDLGNVIGQLEDPDLVFYQNKLLYLSVDSKLIHTTKGAHVGMTLTEVKAAHPTGRQLADGMGGKAWLVTEGTNALLFRLSNSTGKVERIDAGKADTLEFRFTEGEGC